MGNPQLTVVKHEAGLLCRAFGIIQIPGWGGEFGVSHYGLNPACHPSIIGLQILLGVVPSQGEKRNFKENATHQTNRKLWHTNNMDKARKNKHTTLTSVWVYACKRMETFIQPIRGKENDTAPIKLITSISNTSACRETR